MRKRVAGGVLLAFLLMAGLAGASSRSYAVLLIDGKELCPIMYVAYSNSR